MIQNSIFVMIGGAFGALMRYGVSRLLAGITLASMPLATFVANIVGCFLLGAISTYGASHTSIPKSLIMMLTTGMCGAFTTFSTFSAETVKLMEGGQMLSALLYVTASIVIGFSMFWLGCICVR